MYLSLTTQRIFRNISLVLPCSVLAIDLIFTTLIVGRLVYYQRNLKRLLGARSISHYTSIATMIVESASLNIIFQSIALASTFDQLVMNSIFNINLLGQTQASSTHIVTRYQSAEFFCTGVRDAINYFPRRPRESVG